MLNITEVRVKKINKDDFLGYASICIDNELILDGIKLLEGKNGRYIIMPVRRSNSKEQKRNYAYPISDKTREQILNIISDEFDRE